MLLLLLINKFYTANKKYDVNMHSAIVFSVNFKFLEF